LIQVSTLILDVPDGVGLALGLFGAGVFSPAGHLPKRVEKAAPSDRSRSRDVDLSALFSEPESHPGVMAKPRQTAAQKASLGRSGKAGFGDRIVPARVNRPRLRTRIRDDVNGKKLRTNQFAN